MKKVITFYTALVLMIAMAAQARESSNPSLQVDILGERVLAVELADVQDFSQVQFYNEAGEVVGTQRVENKSNIRFLFDLSYLEPGNYSVSLKDRVKQHILPISIYKNHLEVAREELKKVFFPQTEKSENEVLVKLLSNDKNDLRIKIYAAEGELLFQERLTGKMGLIGKNFKFKPGEYIVSVSSDGYAESYRFTF